MAMICQLLLTFTQNPLIFDDNNVVLLRHSFITHYQSGNINEAAEIARRMESLNYTMPLAQEPALIASALSEDWDAVAALSDILSQSDTSLIVAGVARAWALFTRSICRCRWANGRNSPIIEG